MTNLFDKDLKERNNSPTKGSLRNVGKLPGFEDYPSSLNKSFEEGNRNFLNLNRSRSFNCSSSSTHESSSSVSISPYQQDVKSSSTSPDSTHCNDSIPSSSPTDHPSFDNENVKRGSFKGLFRSKSWSLKRRKNRVEMTDIKSSSSLSKDKTDTPKRCSPSYSVKSQDSGFSDSGESNPGVPSKQNTSGRNVEDKERRQKLSLAQQKRLEFLTATNDEDEEDPNLTQLPTHVDNPIYSYILDPKDAKEAKDKVANSVGNIASISEGLRMKRSLIEEDPISPQPNFHQQCVNITDNMIGVNKIKEKTLEKEKLSKNCADFIRPRSVVIQAKATSPLISPKTYNIANNSQVMDHDTLVFSTPLRESFRKRQPRPKTMAVFNLEEAKTPIKRASKNPKLKEMKKTSELRRWSNIEVAYMRNEQGNADKEAPKILSSEVVDVDEHLRECIDDETLRINNLSQFPPGIDHSMIAVWSQLADFKADLPENISTYSYLSNTLKTPRDQSTANRSSTLDQSNTYSRNRRDFQQGTFSKQDLSSTQLSQIDCPSLDMSISRDAVNYTNQLNLTPLSRMESCCVDGTSTQLLVESYCNKFQPKPDQHSPTNHQDELLAASFSINNSSRSATLLSIPPVADGKDTNHVPNTNRHGNEGDNLLLCPRKQNDGRESICNNSSDLNDSRR